MIQRIPWSEFLKQFDWKQGEHISLIGPTGLGKSTLVSELQEYRKYVVAFITKAKDPTIDKLKKRGFVKIKTWEPIHNRNLLWPDIKKTSDKWKQQEVFGEALEEIFVAGAWCVWLDEIRYITETLKLGEQVQLLWLQGRSLGISVVACTQRPFKVPQEMYDQATHLFFNKDGDDRNLMRLREISGVVDKQAIKAAIPELEKFEFLYCNTRTGYACITKVDLAS